MAARSTDSGRPQRELNGHMYPRGQSGQTTGRRARRQAAIARRRARTGRRHSQRPLRVGLETEQRGRDARFCATGLEPAGRADRHEGDERLFMSRWLREQRAARDGDIAGKLEPDAARRWGRLGLALVGSDSRQSH